MTLDLDVQLPMTDREAEVVHVALSVAVELIDQVGPSAGSALEAPARDELVVVARRLDHERRHKGAVPNPNRPMR